MCIAYIDPGNLEADLQAGDCYCAEPGGWTACCTPAPALRPVAHNLCWSAPLCPRAMDVHAQLRSSLLQLAQVAMPG